MKNKRHDFTLVEMLCVVLGMFALASITLLSVRAVNNRAYTSQTQAIIGHVQAGLEAFKTEFGYYPSAPRGSMVFIPFSKDTGEEFDIENINDYAFPLYGGIFFPVDINRSDESNDEKVFYEDFYTREAQTFVRTSGIDELYKFVKPVGWTGTWSTAQREEEPEDPDDVEGHNKYKEVKESHSQKYWRRGLAVVDAWGNPLYYRCPGVINPGGYDLFSAGADGVAGDERRANVGWYSEGVNRIPSIWVHCVMYADNGRLYDFSVNEEGAPLSNIYYLNEQINNQQSYFSNIIGDDIGTF